MKSITAIKLNFEVELKELDFVTTVSESESDSGKSKDELSIEEEQ